MWYDPGEHGLWAIEETPDGLKVRRVDESTEEVAATSDIDAAEPVDDGFGDGAFALEGHLRDYLARSPPSTTAHGPLSLFVDADGRDGVEYQTDCGPADLVFLDRDGNYVVFELKLDRGPDAARNQVQRHMGWIEHHIANGKTVSGVIVANSISDKLKYAGKVAPRAQLMEYCLSVELAPVGLNVGASGGRA
ncbi:endonuclease NucS domain-containing protein [Caballeronia sp. NCTM1]|uniref:endonuclease NucS domain-containing protein n=1 Tax=Caballeronia sp. NCTM1 TaxID=2921753 RepID=UPI0020282AA9